MKSNLWRSLDPVLFVVTLMLIGYGLALNYTASLASMAGRSFFEGPVFRQALYALVGLVVMAVIAYVDYGIYGNLAIAGYAGVVLALAIVFMIGEATHGSRRWIDVGFTQIQPSEFTKVAVVIALARYLASRQGKTKRVATLLVSLGILALPLLLVYRQPDLGTALVLLAIWLGMVMVAGVRILYLAIMGIFSLFALPAVYNMILHGYMRERFEIFLNPSSDPLGAGYNVLQSEISVGSGGFWGKGFTNGTQSQLRFLRIPTTDFIFSVLAEELGFVGAAVLFVLFIILLFRGLRAATLARDPFGQLIAVGIVTMFLSQSFINIGVNIRLLPVTGIPLPLISYGGSSLITMLAAIGILQSIAARPKKVEYFDEPGL